MRRWFLCIAVLVAVLGPSVPAQAEQCYVIYVNRPDGPPIEIEVCP